ncbi:putative outer membrane repeat protein [Methanobrevibacter gottschalkii DSM 11977]|uniref:Putative outer membrane repeat protein n=1 Tax=Methanobrevibacter gottschalkii DSM 11977 TaxID=1122229 RepID=A0A3N5AZ06_9EURY|nr:hypothetical protein [Methanobrevibacter gottschalkii]RPF50199.1 putative outer membrane repeat protein [Methanobrevibacter gottschalkii DSM 11977]
MSINDNLGDASSDLENEIINSKNGDIILIKPGTYNIHNITITNKTITLQGIGNPSDIIIDGGKQSSIFLINNITTCVTFKNLTFINGLSYNFGGAICINTGSVYIDNCQFINNTALNNTNAGAISNYGNEDNKAYLLVNNTLFMNNHADHDGGAVTTCYANSDMYNCVFINNTAVRDGGAVRVSVYGYGHVEDCIFMYNHADEWGGAYYSWSGTSKINRCIFMNNTAGTNGGAVMVSGNLDLENSIIVNNSGGKTGGSFYIQEPMYQAKTYINVNNNLITNNSSPKGQEIYVKWRHSQNLYPDFNDNDWGSEDPNDYKINDPDNVTARSKVKTTTDKSNLLDELNFNALNKYYDLIKDYFPENYLENIKKQAESKANQNKENNKNNTPNNKDEHGLKDSNNTKNSLNDSKIILSNKTTENIETENYLISSNSTTPIGDDEKAYELNETKSVSKSQSPRLLYLVICLVITIIALFIGYGKENSKDK